jgi:hypothetical protein
MIQIISQRPLPLQKFIAEFSHFFSKPLFISFAIYLSGLLLEIKRTNINSIVSKTPLSSYQKIQYFLSDSKWDSDNLNTHRLALLQANPDTTASNRGVLIIDDTSCRKSKDTKKTQGASFQFSSSDNAVINCNSVVFSAYADSHSRYPIDIAPYIPEEDPLCKSFQVTFKSKLELAEELVNLALSRNIPFSHTVFDNWYFSNDYIRFLHSKNLKWVSEAEKSRLIFFGGKWTHADELAKLIPSTKFNKTVTIHYSDGSNKTFFLFSFTSFIKGIKSKLKIIVSAASFKDNHPENPRIFVSNDIFQQPDFLIKKYARRFSIENIFKDLKDNVAFDHFQVRSIKAIKRHWHLSILVHTFLLIAKADSSISDAFDSKNVHTVTDILYKIRTLNNIIAINWISKHPHEFKKHANLADSFKIPA